MTTKFGIIGLGSISNRFAAMMKFVPGVELAAVAASDPARAQAFAQKHGAKKVHASYEDVIRDPDVDVVYNGLTNNFHYEFTKLCLENHKAVLCEKPLVATQAEAEELAALAKANQTFLMEAMWTRCMPAFRKAKEWVKAGRIGEVKLITANFSYRAEQDPENRQFSPTLMGGSLFDVGIYPIDFATGILSEYPASVTGLAKISATGIDESDSVAMSFASGAMVSFNCGFTVEAANEAVVYGTKGHIVFEDCYGPEWCEMYDEENHLLERFADPVRDGFVFQIEHCAEMINNGRLESDLMPLQDTVVSAGIFDTLRRQWGLA